MASRNGGSRQIHQSRLFMLTMAIAGGAVMPWVRGVVQDATSFQTSYLDLCSLFPFHSILWNDRI